MQSKAKNYFVGQNMQNAQFKEYIAIERPCAVVATLKERRLASKGMNACAPPSLPNETLDMFCKGVETSRGKQKCMNKENYVK